MKFLIIYAIGFAATFLIVSIVGAIAQKRLIIFELSFFEILGYSIIWPLYWLYIIIMTIFG